MDVLCESWSDKFSASEVDDDAINVLKKFCKKNPETNFVLTKKDFFSC